jgi:hypothetical protein
MGGPVVLIVVLGLVAIGVLVPLGVRRDALDRRPTGPLLDVERRTGRARWAGLVAGLAVGAAVAATGGLGRGILLAAPLFGLCVLAGVLAGELGIRPPDGRTRTAAVEVRRVRDYLPSRLTGAVGAAAFALLVLLVITTAAAGPDDLGRAGRSFAYHCVGGMRGSHGPWPGSFYSGPLIAVVALGLAAALVCLRRIIVRPRLADPAGAIAVDDALRRRASRAVVGACGILVAVPLAGVGATAGSALLGASCGPVWWSFAGWALLGVLAAAIAMAGWCLSAILAPARVGQPVA